MKGCFKIQYGLQHAAPLYAKDNYANPILEVK